MGQSTYAIMYGVLEEELPPNAFGEDDSGYQENKLVAAWQTHCQPKIEAYDQRHPRKSWADPRGYDVYVPQSPYEGLEMIGFYVAIGGSGKPGIAELDGFVLADAKAAYPDHYKSARRRWNRFAKWARSNGYNMPRARLFLTVAETA